MNRALLLLTGLFVVRFVVSLAHGLAHHQLAVPLAAWQQAFVLWVITVAPIVCLGLLWFRRGPILAGILAVLLVASWAFGVYFHFGPLNPDHVMQVPDAPGRSLFIITAVMLATVEPIVAWSALRLATKSGRQEGGAHA